MLLGPFLATENMPRQLRIVHRAGGSSWQSYRIIAIFALGGQQTELNQTIGGGVNRANQLPLKLKFGIVPKKMGQTLLFLVF